MNKSQKLVLLMSGFVAVVVGLVPPWSHTVHYQTIDRANPAGYALIVNPPQPEYEDLRSGVRLDTNRLVIQWIVVAIATAIGVVVLHDKGSMHPTDAGARSAETHDTSVLVRFG
jgi:hypothetical protein